MPFLDLSHFPPPSTLESSLLDPQETLSLCSFALTTGFTLPGRLCTRFCDLAMGISATIEEGVGQKILDKKAGVKLSL